MELSSLLRGLHVLSSISGAFPREQKDFMDYRLKIIMPIVLTVLVSASPAVAAVTHSGGGVFKITVVTETNSHSTNFAGFVDLPGSAVAITVPAGKKQLVQARFTGESGCQPVSPDPYWCSIQIVAVSPSGTIRMLPDSGSDAAFDTVTASQDLWEGHAVERSVVLPAGKYTVKAQWMVTDPGITFSLDDWSFTVTQYAEGK
jgi:hypothetical protein